MNMIEITRFKPLSYACAEAMNTLCTNLTFAGEDKKVIILTSAQAHEGKSFVTMNVMRALAGLGHRVVLVDADLRRSQITSKYGLKLTEGTGVGLAHYLAGMCSVENVVYKTSIPNASIVPLGHDVSNSLALLTTGRMGKLLGYLRERFDYVLVDAPPVGVIIDTAEIAKSCDGTVIALKYNAVSRRELVEVKRQIDRSGCPILGVVLNSVAFDSLSSKHYYHKSAYTSYESDYMKKPEKKKTGRKK